MDIQTEQFISPDLNTISTKALGEWLLASAASQGKWPITVHQEFLDEMSNEVSDAVDKHLCLVLPPDAPADPIFLPPPKTVEIACATETGPFEHAIDIDSGESNVQLRSMALGRRAYHSWSVIA